MSTPNSHPTLDDIIAELPTDTPDLSQLSTKLIAYTPPDRLAQATKDAVLRHDSARLSAETQFAGSDRMCAVAESFGVSAGQRTTSLNASMEKRREKAYGIQRRMELRDRTGGPPPTVEELEIVFSAPDSSQGPLSYSVSDESADKARQRASDYSAKATEYAELARELAPNADIAQTVLRERHRLAGRTRRLGTLATGAFSAMVAGSQAENYLSYLTDTVASSNGDIKYVSIAILAIMGSVFGYTGLSSEKLEGRIAQKRARKELRKNTARIERGQ